MNFVRHPVAAAALAFSLTACGSAAGGHAVPQAAPPLAFRSDSTAATCPCFAVAYSFGSTPTDGRDPDNWLNAPVLLNGVLYGVTDGGKVGQDTAFSVTSAGKEQVLYRFAGKPTDGTLPSGLTELNGILYGVTLQGGTNNVGTVFSLTTSGTETVLHSFANNGSDGYGPITSPTAVNGVLYGTAIFGGLHNGGVIYSITPSGAENVLYSFANTLGDASALADVNGILYGTTLSGGTKGHGTLFRFNPTSKKVSFIYNFSTFTGAEPNGLTYHNGVLYGTTYKGGDLAISGGDGTIFSVTQSGVYKVLHEFRGHDGANPQTNLVELRGVLYGATTFGGTKGGGVIFGFNPTTQTFSVLYDKSPSTGFASSMVVLNDKLWGTTELGGKFGHGAVFDLTP